MKPLWPHQEEALGLALSRSAMMLAMDMGTGKSRVIVDLVSRFARGSTILIVVPKSVLPVWLGEFEKFYLGGVDEDVAPETDVAVVTLTKGDSTKKIKRIQEVGHRRKAINPAAKLVFVLNYETARTKVFAKFLALVEWTLVVLDESHRIKAPTGTQSKAMWPLRAKKRICLTGTPMPHSPLDIWSQFRFLDPTVFGFSFSKFKGIYALFGLLIPEHLPDHWKKKLEELPTPYRAHASSLLGTKTFRSALRGTMHRLLVAWLEGMGEPLSVLQWEALGKIDPKRLRSVVGFKNLPMLEAKMAPLTFQVAIDDVLDLPEAHHVTKPILLEAKGRRIYDEMQRDLVAWIRAGVNVTAANALDRLNKLHQVTGGSMIVEDSLDGTKELVLVGTEKFDALREILDDLPRDEPFVVFCLYRGDIAAAKGAASESGRRNFELSGQKNELAEWQESTDGSVLVVQIQSGGLGISLVRSRYCCYYSLGFSLGDYEQSLARVRRPGQERTVTYFHLIATGRVDERVYSALRARKDVVAEVLRSVAEIASVSRDLATKR